MAWLGESCSLQQDDLLRVPAGQSLRPKPSPQHSESSGQNLQVLALLEELLKRQSGIEANMRQHQEALLQKLDENHAAARTMHQNHAVLVQGVEEKVSQVAQVVQGSLGVVQLPSPPRTEEATIVVESKGQLANKSQPPEHHARKKPQLSFIATILFSQYFELSMVMVIFVNFVAMFLQLQFKGLHLGFELGLTSNDGNWETHKVNFAMLENILNAVYIVELGMRLWVFGRRFPKKPENVMDAFIVVSSCLDVYVLQPMEIKVVNLAVLRLTRLSRIFMLAKVLRKSPVFSELRVLIRTLYTAFRGVIWAFLLLSFIIIIGSILMAQMVFPHLEDDSTLSPEMKKWLFTNFGTMFAAMHTMFECTFTGGWRFYSRPLIEEVSYIFGFFWLLWVVLVNFTTMRVVGALFLKATIAVSERDAENCAMNQLKNKGKSAEMLRDIFNDADVSGDGCISESEFVKMMKSDDVTDQFEELGLDVDEVGAFFTVLSADDGEADYNEFITGALGMATSAPTLDRLKAMQGHLSLEAGVHQVNLMVSEVCRKLQIDTTKLVKDYSDK